MQNTIIFKIVTCLLLILIGIIVDEVPMTISTIYSGLLGVINTNLKPLLFLFGTFLAIKLSLRKIGNDVRVNFTLNNPGYLPKQIISIVLMNQKDIPIIIQKILVQFPDNRAIVLKKYDSPLILGPLSSEKIEVSQYSEIFIENNKKYEPDFASSIVKLQTPSGYISCTFPKFKGKLIDSLIIPRKTLFHGHTYNNEVKYALEYKYNKKALVAFILHNGQFYNEWDFNQPRFSEGFSIKEVISINELDSINSWKLYEIKEKEPRLVCTGLTEN